MAAAPFTVTHFSTHDTLGGSARSASKIHHTPQELGVRSRMLVRHRHSADPTVGLISRGPWLVADRLTTLVTRSQGWQYRFLPSSTRLARHPWVREADVLQLYNLHGAYFSPAVLPELSAARPVVWRLSDMWPLTGHCTYSGDCTRWLTGCGQCPDLAQYPALARDTTADLWTWKRQLYTRSRLTIVAPSSWTLDLAARSPLLSHFRRELIPNGLDETVFRPQDRAAALAELGIPDDLPTVLVVAHRLLGDTRKGFHLIQQAAAWLKTHGPPCRFLLVGQDAQAAAATLPLPAWPQDLVNDDQRLARIYAASSLYLHAAVAENVANTIFEGMACGLPVLAYDVGGIKDAVKPGQTGELVLPVAGEPLGRALATLLAAPASMAEMGARGRRLVLERFTNRRQGESFLALYQDLHASFVPGPPSGT